MSPLKLSLRHFPLPDWACQAHQGRTQNYPKRGKTQGYITSDTLRIPFIWEPVTASALYVRGVAMQWSPHATLAGYVLTTQSKTRDGALQLAHIASKLLSPMFLRYMMTCRIVCQRRSVMTVICGNSSAVTAPKAQRQARLLLKQHRPH